MPLILHRGVGQLRGYTQRFFAQVIHNSGAFLRKCLLECYFDNFQRTEKSFNKNFAWTALV